MHPITTETKLLAVFGWPVAHSLSPAIHNAALQAANLNYVYLAFPVSPEQFETAARGLASAGSVGINCTIPHKHAALAICDEVSDVARAVGTVNTLDLRNGRIFGTNTDVEGFVETLRQDGHFDFVGRSVVLIGAGGAGRGMALGALGTGAAQLTILNRTVEKAEDLARDLKALYPQAIIRALGTDTSSSEVQQALTEAHLVANATSLGLHEGEAFPCPVDPLKTDCMVFDAAYTAQRSTAWLRAAAQRGCPTLDGLGMLVRQGAASFRIWTGVDPDLDAMFQALPGGAKPGKP